MLKTITYHNCTSLRCLLSSFTHLLFPLKNAVGRTEEQDAVPLVASGESEQKGCVYTYKIQAAVA